MGRDEPLSSAARVWRKPSLLFLKTGARTLCVGCQPMPSMTWWFFSEAE